MYYQQHISEFNRTLDKTNVSIQDFAQVKLLEFKKSESDYEPLLEQGKDNSTVATVEKKKGGGNFRAWDTYRSILYMNILMINK